MEVLSQSSNHDDKPLPPGVRFYPTDEEIVICFLKKKICGLKIESHYVCDVDVYKFEPEELPGLSKQKNGDRQWFFFSPRDPNLRNRARTSRATSQGFWKVTGKKVTVTSNSHTVGIRRTLVFYRGRAHIRERTDWVMHEYTMDEKELSKCKNVQGDYAVYKVKKKSGRGPKNGEQYGPPVNEEDLADDSVDQEVLVEEPETDTTVIESDVGQETIFSSDDLNVSLTNLISDEAPLEFPQTDPCANALPQVGGREESASTVVDLRSQDHSLPMSVEASDSEQQLSNAPESFDLTKSDISQLPPFQTPEAKSASNFSELASCPREGDFLEMADLGGSEIYSNIENPSGSGNWQFEDLNASLYELDWRHDVGMFFNDLGMPLNEMGMSLNDLGTFEDGTVPNPYQNENVNHVSNPMDGQFQSNPDFANAGQIDNRMPMPDPAMDDFCLSGLQRSSGVLCESTNFAAETNQNQVGEDESFFSRVYSVLWDFVESLPTTPASAAENDPVNQTLDRMPSFNRRRVSMKSTTISAIDSSFLMIRRTSSRRKVGSFLFYVLGALCAILWVFIGAVRLCQRCIYF